MSEGFGMKECEGTFKAVDLKEVRDEIKYTRNVMPSSA